MKFRFCSCLIYTLVFISHAALASHSEGESNLEGTSLTREEVNAYLTADSLDLGKVADINHFPNPKKVLKIKNLLNLNRVQNNRSTISYKLMRKYAIKTGRKIVLKERQLNNLFQQPNVDLGAVKKLVNEIAILKGKLRFIHLRARVNQKSYLTNEQITTYLLNKNTETPVLYAFDE